MRKITTPTPATPTAAITMTCIAGAVAPATTSTAPARQKQAQSHSAEMTAARIVFTAALASCGTFCTSQVQGTMISLDAQSGPQMLSISATEKEVKGGA